jgi:hypothetical protein
MKSLHYLLIISILFMITSANGQNTNSPQYFKNAEEAVKKATSDLIEVINSKREFNFGVNPNELQKARMGSMIQNSEINFDLLLKANAESVISKMAEKPKNQLFPLFFENKIIIVVELREEEKGWLIGGFSSSGITNELNTINQSVSGIEKIRVIKYEVPNLNTNIYEVQRDNKTLLFSNYNGLFSLKEPINSERLFSVLKEDALKFQKEFGQRLQKEKLVY